MKNDHSNLKRSLQSMPSFVKQALEERNLMQDYNMRPAYQRNDYLMWINKAVRQETKLKRLNQILDELESGGVYMKMEHPASKKARG